MPKSSPPTSNVIAISEAALVVRRRPGRPREVRPAVVPDFDEFQYVQQIAKLTEDFIDADPVVVASTAPGTTEIECIEAVMRSVAHEQAALLHDRLKLQREGRDGAQVASRRVDALQKLASLTIAREHLRRASGTMDNETVSKLLAMLLSDVREVAEEVMSSETVDTFLAGIEMRAHHARLPGFDGVDGEPRVAAR